MSNVASIVGDFQCIAKEANDTVSICTLKCQNKLYAELFSKLSEQEKEIIFNVAFYEELVTAMEKEKKIIEVTRRSVNTKYDVCGGFLDNMKRMVDESRGRYVGHEEKTRLLDALCVWLDKVKGDNSLNKEILDDGYSGEERVGNYGKNSEKINRAIDNKMESTGNRDRIEYFAAERSDRITVMKKPKQNLCYETVENGQSVDSLTRKISIETVEEESFSECGSRTKRSEMPNKEMNEETRKGYTRESTAESIEMSVMNTNENEPSAAQQPQTHKAKHITALSRLRRSRTPSETFESKDIRKLFCMLHKTEENLRQKLDQHLHASYEEAKVPVKASLIKRVLTEQKPDYTEVRDNTPYIEKLRSLLKKPIRFKEIDVGDVKAKFKTEIDWKQCAEKIEQTAIKTSLAKADTKWQLDFIRQGLQQEIEFDDLIEKVVKSLEKNDLTLNKENLRRGFDFVHELRSDQAFWKSPSTMCKRIKTTAATYRQPQQQKRESALTTDNHITIATMTDDATTTTKVKTMISRVSESRDYGKILELFLNEGQSPKEVQQLIFSAIRNIEAYNRKGTGKEASNLTIMVKQLDKIANVLIEESKKPNFRLDAVFANPACKEMSKQILVNALNAAIR